MFVYSLRIKFFLFFILVGGIFLVRESVRTSGSPTFDSVIITESSGGSALSSINLVENSYKTIYVRGAISEPDGCDDLDESTFSSVLYRSGIAGGTSCSADNNNCYRGLIDGACAINGCSIGTETTVNYECSYALPHYTEPTDSGDYAAQNWTAWTRIKDLAQTNAEATSTTELNSLVALDVDSLSNYGTLSFGATSTDDVTVAVYNKGNTRIDVQISGTALVCANGGYVAVENQRYSLYNGQTYGDMTPLSATPSLAQLNLNKQTSGTTSSVNVYFKLVMPQAGLAGVCTGTNTVTAVQDT